MRFTKRELPGIHIVILCLPSGSASAIVQDFTPCDIDNVQRAFDELGPTARLCIDCVKIPDQLALHAPSRERALKKLKMKDLIKAIEDSSDLKIDVSHTLFLVRRVEGLNPGDMGYLQDFTLEPITPSVRKQLKFKLMEAEHEERLQLYKLFETVPESRRVAGVAFESIA